MPAHKVNRPCEARSLGLHSRAYFSPARIDRSMLPYGPKQTRTPTSLMSALGGKLTLSGGRRRLATQGRPAELPAECRFKHPGRRLAIRVWPTQNATVRRSLRGSAKPIMLPSDATVGAAMGHPARGGSSSRKQRSKRSKPAGRGSVKSVSKRSTKVARRRGFSGAEAKEEPARLAKELSEALQQQAATADVLRVISRSTFDLQAVLDALTESAARLCKADMATITRKGEGADFYHVTNYNFPPDWVEYARKHPFKPGRGSVHGRSLIKKRAVQVVDVLADPEWTRGEQQRRAGFRTVLAVPLQRDGEPIGVFILCRKTVSPFLEKQIELMSGFADQAVIAIENTRLFNETQEALERQTATADILKVIASSPSDVQPVFEAIAESARLVVGGHSCGVTRVVGDNLHLAAFTTGSEAGRDTLARSFPIPLSSPRTLARVARTGRVVMLADMERDGDDTSKEIARARGYRSMLVVPMLRDSAAIGTIAVTRQEPGGFDDNAIGLLKTFADQAVIAIENARLFNETQEALERQTATADILKVIASSSSRCSMPLSPMPTG